MCIYEQLEKLISDLNQAKRDINTTHYEVLDSEQLNTLANECMTLLSICNKAVRANFKEVLGDEKNCKRSNN